MDRSLFKQEEPWDAEQPVVTESYLDVRNEPIANDGSVGELFKAGREAGGFSQRVIASKLNLSIDQVDALEKNEYHVLPAPIFIKDYIKRYANFLGMPPEPMIDAYKKLSESNGPELARVSFKQPGNSRQLSLRWIGYVLVLGLLGLVVFWLQSQDLNQLFRSEVTHESPSTLDDHQPLAVPLQFIDPNNAAEQSQLTAQTLNAEIESAVLPEDVKNNVALPTQTE